MKFNRRVTKNSTHFPIHDIDYPDIFYSNTERLQFIVGKVQQDVTP